VFARPLLKRSEVQLVQIPFLKYAFVPQSHREKAGFHVKISSEHSHYLEFNFPITFAPIAQLRHT
jgi:hypothetical protein